MKTFTNAVEAMDMYGRKKTISAWVYIMIYAAFVLTLDIYLLLTEFIPERHTGGIWFFGLSALFFWGSLIYQLLHKPTQYMVIHTRTGIATTPEPVSEDEAKQRLWGTHEGDFSYVPYKEYLKTKETR